MGFFFDEQNFSTSLYPNIKRLTLYSLCCWPRQTCATSILQEGKTHSKQWHVLWGIACDLPLSAAHKILFMDCYHTAMVLKNKLVFLSCLGYFPQISNRKCCMCLCNIQIYSISNHRCHANVWPEAALTMNLWHTHTLLNNKLLTMSLLYYPL